MTMEQQHHDELLKGVFVGPVARYIGTGTTRKKTVKDEHVYAEGQADGVVEYQVLNANFVPSGGTKKMPLEKFIGSFTPDPEMYQKKTLPAVRELTKTLAKAERLRNRGESYGAEFEYNNALKLDMANVRGNLGLGMTYLDRGDTEQAGEVVRRLVSNEDTFNEDNKHMFNDFGIMLRKNKMFDQALTYYATAYKVCKDDENLLFNIARTLYDKGELEKALKFVEKALDLNPAFEEAIKFHLALVSGIAAKK